MTTTEVLLSDFIEKNAKYMRNLDV